MVICNHRKDTESFNRAPEIQITATVIGSSGFLSKFKEWFVPLYHRGNSEKITGLLLERLQSTC